MKEVVKREPTNIIDLEDVSSNRIYAFRYFGQVYKVIYDGRCFCFIPMHRTDGIFDTKRTQKAELKDTIEVILDRGFCVYEFDNEEEFFKWGIGG